MPQATKFIPVYTQLDQLSNSVVGLIKQNRLDEAEAVSRRTTDGLSGSGRWPEPLSDGV